MKHPIVLFVLCAFAQTSAKILNISSQELRIIAHKIWHNESGCSHSKLVWWNEGEDFASVGICHFIWYPKHRTSKFQETFPAFLRYAKTNGAKIPAFIAQTVDYICPWQRREDFLEQQQSVEMAQLHEFFIQTMDLQIRFVVQELDDMLRKLQHPHKPKLMHYINTLQQTACGLYCLLDYYNFKGSGLNEQERYNGQGWGLIQVLEDIDDKEFEQNPCAAFAQAATLIIERRVLNSPQERNESRWLKGWKNRIKTYGAFSNIHS